MKNFGRKALGAYLFLSSCGYAPEGPSPTNNVEGVSIGYGALFSRETENGRVTVTQIGVGDDRCIIDTRVTQKGTSAVIATSKTIFTRRGELLIDERNGDDLNHTELKPTAKKDVYKLNGVPVRALSEILIVQYELVNRTCTDVANGNVPDFDEEILNLREKMGRAFMHQFPKNSTT